MPKVTQQSPPSTAVKKPIPNGKHVSVIDRIAPITFGDNGLKMLIYGRSGSGKTTLASTFPGPILWIVCSGGSRPGELRSVNTPELRKKISQVVLESTAELRQIVDYIESEGKFATVVLDHATGFQDLTLKEILGLDELPAQKSWGMATQQQYGQSSLQCKEGFRALLNLSGNVLILSQEREFNAEGTSELVTPTVSAALTPSVTGWLCPACDYVVQTYIKPLMVLKESKINDKKIVTESRGKGVEYALRTEPHDVYQTKLRMPKGVPLPAYISDPSYDKIMQLVNGKG